MLAQYIFFLFLVFTIGCLFYEKLNLKLLCGTPFSEAPREKDSVTSNSVVTLFSIEHTESIISPGARFEGGFCQTAVM